MFDLGTTRDLEEIVEPGRQAAIGDSLAPFRPDEYHGRLHMLGHRGECITEIRRRLGLRQRAARVLQHRADRRLAACRQTKRRREGQAKRKRQCHQ